MQCGITFCIVTCLPIWAFWALGNTGTEHLHILHRVLNMESLSNSFCDCKM